MDMMLNENEIKISHLSDFFFLRFKCKWKKKKKLMKYVVKPWSIFINNLYRKQSPPIECFIETKVVRSNVLIIKQLQYIYFERTIDRNKDSRSSNETKKNGLSTIEQTREKNPYQIENKRTFLCVISVQC